MKKYLFAFALFFAFKTNATVNFIGKTNSGTNLILWFFGDTGSGQGVMAQLRYTLASTGSTQYYTNFVPGIYDNTTGPGGSNYKITIPLGPNGNTSAGQAPGDAINVFVEGAKSDYGTTNNGFEYTGFAWSLSSPLPVVLKSFSAKSQGKESLLNWKTTSERNNDRFDIQRSSDAKNWEIIAAIKGKGTIENEEHYEYQDKNPNLGVNYYRLKQVDFDGSFEFSKIVQTRILENANFNVFPNPSNGNINVSGIETSTFLKIFNSQGVEILKREVSENQSLENIPTGKYFLQISNGIEKQSKVLIVN